MIPKTVLILSFPWKTILKIAKSQGENNLCYYINN